VIETTSRSYSEFVASCITNASPTGSNHALQIYLNTNYHDQDYPDLTDELLMRHFNNNPAPNQGPSQPGNHREIKYQRRERVAEYIRSEGYAYQER
jgi:hypothetical protein